MRAKRADGAPANVYAEPKKKFLSHQTRAEAVQRLRDEEQSIDSDLEDAFAKVDRARKERGRKSLAAFISEYLVGGLFEFPPEGMFLQALEEMEKAVLQARPYNIELPRGSGKTTAAEACMLWLISYGIRKYCVIVSNNQRQANAIVKDFQRIVTDPGTAYAQDFPEVVLPFVRCNGGFRRRLLFRGHTVDLSVTSQQIVLGRLEGEDGKPLPTSQSVIAARGKAGGLRGMKHGSLRPDTAILDDLQDSEEASSPDQVQKTADIINKDVMNLSSGRRLAVLMTSTPIVPEDLCERIEKDPQWKTTKFKAVVKWPDDIAGNGMEGLWGRYFRIYDQECISDKTHEKSLDFYKKNKADMDKGAVLFQDRFNPSDGHISGLQALLEKRHLIGDAAFESEMQMSPKKMEAALDISPRDVLEKTSMQPFAEVPPGASLVVAAADLNVSYAITLAVTAFHPDQSATVLAHRILKTDIPGVLNDLEYSKKVYEALSEAGQWLKSLKLPIAAWGIDAGGRNWETVTRFAKASAQLCGMPACAMAGRAHHMFNPNAKSRLRDAVNSTVLCGDAKERAMPGAGQKYIFFDSDYYKEKFQRAAISPLGAPGGLSLYKAPPEQHSDFAVQCTNERLKAVRRGPTGKDVYSWASREPHDYLDCMAMSYAIAGSQGISGQAQPKHVKPPAKRIPQGLKKRRPSFRFV